MLVYISVYNTVNPLSFLVTSQLLQEPVAIGSYNNYLINENGIETSTVVLRVLCFIYIHILYVCFLCLGKSITEIFWLGG